MKIERRLVLQALASGFLVARGAAARATPAAAASAEGTPENAIRKTIDDAFAVLKDKSLAGKEKRGKRIAALRQIADRVFDWSEMARSSLGAAWRSLDGPQRARFVEVFKSILAAQYMDDIDRFQGTETLTVDGSTREGEDTVVRSTLVTSSRERVPIDYRMRQQQGKWTVVDLSIEGVSLVNHFRKTFSGALANMTIDQLIERLKKQVPPERS
jgi:phospholipid transport system substrate-binding protein